MHKDTTLNENFQISQICNITENTLTNVNILSYILRRICLQRLGLVNYGYRVLLNNNERDRQCSDLAYLCSQGRARNGVVGLAWQIGQAESSSAEVEDLSLENGRRKFFTDDEFKRGRSSNSISCHQHKNSNLVSSKSIHTICS